MKNHEVATIKNVSSLSIADPTFFVGSPYRYDLRISEGDYGVVTIDSENAAPGTARASFRRPSA